MTETGAKQTIKGVMEKYGWSENVAGSLYG